MKLLDLYKLALARIGSRNTLQSPVEATNEARQCSALWPTVRDAVLRDFDWPFARRIVALSRLSDQDLVTPEVPPDRWLECYAYPEDCLILRTVDWDVPVPGTVPLWEVALNSDDQMRIYANDQDLWATYTRAIEDVGLFDATAADAAAWRLAQELAMPIVGKFDVMAAMAQQYERMILRAAAKAANEERPRETPLPDWLRARGGVATWDMRYR